MPQQQIHCCLLPLETLTQCFYRCAQTEYIYDLLQNWDNIFLKILSLSSIRLKYNHVLSSKKCSPITKEEVPSSTLFFICPLDLKIYLTAKITSNIERKKDSNTNTAFIWYYYIRHLAVSEQGIILQQRREHTHPWNNEFTITIFQCFFIQCSYYIVIWLKFSHWSWKQGHTRLRIWHWKKVVIDDCWVSKWNISSKK